MLAAIIHCVVLFIVLLAGYVIGRRDAYSDGYWDGFKRAMEEEEEIMGRES